MGNERSREKENDKFQEAEKQRSNENPKTTESNE